MFTKSTGLTELLLPTDLAARKNTTSIKELFSVNHQVNHGFGFHQL
jgi:hypothetical protein